MRKKLGTYDLFDRRAGAFVPCDLFEGIAEHNLQNIELQWQPAFRAAEDAKIDVQDAHWEWRRKHGYIAPLLNYRSFVVECDGATQGLMIAELSLHRCRLPEQAGKHLVYVDFISTAPWNRPLVDQPRYKGVGRLLISTAINASFDEDFDGRIGLHSLSEAEAFYRAHVGMTDLGLDPNYPRQLRYFEMTTRQAETYFAPTVDSPSTPDTQEESQ